MITNTQSGTNVHEVADGIYRINTPVTLPGGVGQFNFNQYLVLDDEPLLFHTGLRGLFPVVSEAIRTLMPIEQLRYIGFSHFEADEEQEHHDAELGDMQHGARIIDQLQDMRANQHTGSKIPKNRAQLEKTEQWHCDNASRQQGDRNGQIACASSMIHVRSSSRVVPESLVRDRR